jgi:protein associated with RNAse G/E
MPKEDTEDEGCVRKKLPTMLVEDTDMQPYITTDINVVAYLTMKNYNVHSIAREEGSNRAAFCFMLPTPEEKKQLQQHVRDYHNNIDNFRLYSDCWRNAKGFVHNLK